MPSVAPYNIDALGDKIIAALDGEAEPVDDVCMADYGWEALLIGRSIFITPRCVVGSSRD